MKTQDEVGQTVDDQMLPQAGAPQSPVEQAAVESLPHGAAGTPLQPLRRKADEAAEPTDQLTE